MTIPRYVVSGDSMSPSFRAGDCLLISVSAYRRRTPARGDVVIVLDPRDRSQRFLKRIVGLPGEEVRLFEGVVWIDGAVLREPYLGGLPATLGLDESDRKLGQGEYFVMGDNRAHSTDSREFGPVDIGLIAGRAWLRCWPVSRLRRLG